MDTRIIIVRHGKLDLPYRSHAEMPFDVLAALGRGEMDPGPDRSFAEERMKSLIASGEPYSGVRRIFVSPSRRCTESAGIYAELLAAAGKERPEIGVAEELREVFFDLRRLAPPAFKNGFDMKEVNRLILAGMAEGTAESALAAYERIGRFFRQIESITGGALVITHGFLLRVMEIYVQTKGVRPAAISCGMLEATHDDLYLRGFIITKDLKEITHI